MISFVLALVLWLSPGFALVSEPVYDELENLDLVEALVRDGKVDAARVELSKAKPTPRYWLVKGDYHMAAQDWPQAITSYRQVGNNEPQLAKLRGLKMARVFAKLEKYKECASAFLESDDLWKKSEEDVITKALCEYRAQLGNRAWITLRADRNQPLSFALLREQVSLALEMSLIQQGLDLALSHAQLLSSSELLSLAELFNNKKAVVESLTLVELARSRQPMDLESNLVAAQIFFQQGNLHSTVDAFERASRTDSRYAYHVAELRRQMGNRQSATYSSQLISNPKERLKSRMALYVDQGNYPLISSLQEVIARSELNKDDELNYALAYSLLRQGDLDSPLKLLQRVQKPELVAKATLLKKSIFDCRANEGVCRL